MVSEITAWDVATTVAMTTSREVSVVEVVEAHLAHIEEVDAHLNAVTNDVGDEARRDAAALDRALAAGVPAGPLHGVPVTIKENVDVAGQPTPNGMRALAGVVAPGDSPLVASLRSAGAVIIGRTNTPEMSYRWHTTNPLRGETRNPWSTGRTPGGSSGGAASAVAAGIGVIAHGNDLGGSLRQPANCCGVATIRPSLGRVPAFNPSAPAERTMGLQLMSVQGPIARSVADVRAGLDVMAAPSPLDPWHRAAAPSTRRGPCRVAVTHGAPGIATHPDVRLAIDEAAAHLEAAGYDVEPADPPHLDEIGREWMSILATETSLTLTDELRATLSDEFVAMLGWMFSSDVVLDLDGYVRALARRLTVARAWTTFLDERPLVLAPVSQEPPFAPGDDASGPERFAEIVAGHTLLVAVNYVGLPAAAVPVHRFDHGPVGVQLIGAPFAEDLCLDAAAAIERATGVMTEHLAGITDRG